MPCIESREADRYHKLSEASWGLCEGTENLTLAECNKLKQDWEKDDTSDFPWLRVEYRIVAEPTPPTYYLYYILPSRRLVNVNNERGARVSTQDKAEADALAAYWSLHGPAYPVTIDRNHGLHNTCDGKPVMV